MNRWVIREDLMQGEVSLPGLQVADVERTGSFFSAWRVGRLLETVACQVNGPRPASVGNIGQLNKELDDFTIIYWHRVTPEFYTLQEHRSLLKCAVRLSYAGRTSFQLHATVSKDGRIVAESKSLQVCVDKVSREPRPLPEWWLNQFKPLLPQDAKLERLRFIEKPKHVKTFRTVATCRYEDIDTYEHMNNANYTRHCLAAACEASLEHFFSVLSGNIFCHHMKEMRQLYISQWSLGSKATIDIWENPTNPFEVHFDVIINVKVIYQNSILFHDSESLKCKL